MTDKATFDTEAFKQFERDGYSKVAEGYNAAAAKTTSQVIEPMLDAVDVGAGTRLLDVACGPGILASHAVGRGAAVTGLDMAEPMLAIARSRCPEAEFHSGDAENLPFEEGRFDAVTCAFGILHFPEPERAMAEVYRVLKPGGRYAFTCWRPPGSNPFFGLIIGSVQAHGNTDVGLPPGPPVFRFGDPAECEKALNASGFVTESVREIPIVWRFSDPNKVAAEVVASTARIGPLLTRQSDEQRRNIEDAIAAGAKAYQTNDTVEIPAPAVLALARKP